MGAVISILGVILQASAVKLYMMLIGRIVSGFAIGLMSVGVPVYLTEQAMRTPFPRYMSKLKLTPPQRTPVVSWSGSYN